MGLNGQAEELNQEISHTTNKQVQPPFPVRQLETNTRRQSSSCAGLFGEFTDNIYPVVCSRGNLLSDRNREALKISRRQGRSHLLVSVSSHFPTAPASEMLMSLCSHILCAWFAFLLPSYATFKALSHRPLSEHELQRWTMYWSVVGPFVAFEYTAEWLISWLPFYWEAKTIFFLYLSLPQTQGSTYIYTAYLEPFFTQNEADLDEGIVQAQTNILTFIQTRLIALWESILNAANKRQATPTTRSIDSNISPTSGASALQNVFSLYQSYGSSVMNAVGITGLAVSSIQDTPDTAMQRGSTQTSSVEDVHNIVDSSASKHSSENPNASFPEPYHF
ncbi:hypothetical protein Ac2012v2_001022 [Leucoagaricus gongylophorus]